MKAIDRSLLMRSVGTRPETVPGPAAAPEVPAPLLPPVIAGLR